MFLTVSLSSILATNTLTLIFLYKVSFTKGAALTGYFLLGVGCSAWLISASARVYGKRHAYVFGAVLLVAGSIWGAVGMSSLSKDVSLLLLASDYNSFLGARIMQGFGTGPFEMLVPSSIGDMLCHFRLQCSLLGTLFISGVKELQFRQCPCLVCPS